MDDRTYYTAPDDAPTTQWDDAQRRLGNLAPAEPRWKAAAWAPAGDAPTGAALVAGDADAVEELEGEFDDDAFLEEFRVKRLAELKDKAEKEHASSLVSTITAADYVSRVTRASADRWVVCHLYGDRVRACAEVDDALGVIASGPAGADTTFVRAEAASVSPGFPDAALPTLLAYRGGECVATLKGGAALAPRGGARPTPASVAAALLAAAPGCLAESRRTGSGSDSGSE
jgi:hypothetical protein